MMSIPCPFCGPRNEVEFAFGGPVKPDRPDPNTVSPEDWTAYLTQVPNPLGPVQERWYHVKGCGTWKLRATPATSSPSSSTRS